MLVDCSGADAAACTTAAWIVFNSPLGGRHCAAAEGAFFNDTRSWIFRHRFKRMYPLIPVESLAGVFEALCYFSTILVAVIGCLMTRPA
jgi:hypothetical protein